MSVAVAAGSDQECADEAGVGDGERAVDLYWKTIHKDTFSATNAWQHEDQEPAVVPLAGKDKKGLILVLRDLWGGQ